MCLHKCKRKVPCARGKNGENVAVAARVLIHMIMKRDMSSQEKEEMKK